MADYPDPEVGRSMKEAADREARARAERAKREAENRGDVDARAIVDAMDTFNYGQPRTGLFDGDIADIVAKVEEESAQ